MCSMRNADDSWQDSARELMEDWNPGSEEEPSHHSSAHPAAALPCKFGLDNEPASPPELGAEDSFPGGPTLLYKAFAPLSAQPAGPGPGSTLGRYGVTGFPETYFVDRRGRLVGDRVVGEVSADKLTSGIQRALAS